MREFQKGDYVLATKYHDGDPGDHFCIGLYDHEMPYDPPRHHIVDSAGNPFRGNGFRRVARVTKEKGEWFVRNLKWIAQGTHSVWFWYYAPKEKRDEFETAFCSR
jgi:hypothetical protein